MIYTYQNLERNGRLANQLWQVASTIGIAEANGGEARFRPDWEYRPYFSVPDEYFEPIPRGITTKDFGDGYLQELHYWSDIEDKIMEFFKPSALVDSNLQPLSRSASIHVRRGDYLKYPNHHPLPTMYYYEDAISTIEADQPDTRFYMFSDDIEWCKTAFSAYDNIEFVEGIARPVDQAARYRAGAPMDYLDLFAMTDCTRHIICNSSFSWWGAMLSGDKEVIYPSLWYGPELKDIPWRRMIPNTWKEISC